MKESYLVHHGIKGQKWGVRRYLNDDGTLNAKGMKRYANKKHGARKMLADTAYSETVYSKKGRRDRAISDAVMSVTGATYGYLLSSGKNGTTRLLSTLGGMAAGALVGEGSYRLGAKFGASLGSLLLSGDQERQWQNAINSGRQPIDARGKRLTDE